ncbi:hypothetical protein B0H19DRAFT_1268242 [Mycena capillaripes]|nr:hypothetical protein B0H19DRAFT_1268242 [Mycena capillaripes]
MGVFPDGGRYGSIETATSTGEVQAFSLRVYIALQTTMEPSAIDDSSDDDSSDVDDDITVPGLPHFSCIPAKANYHLHTYAPVHTLLYNLGTTALRPVNSGVPKGSLMSLTEQAGARWAALSRKDVVAALPPLKIKIPGTGGAKGAKKAQK